MSDTQWANIEDYYLEYQKANTLIIRTKDDGNVAVMGQIAWENRRILEVVGEVSMGDIYGISITGEPLNVALKDGKTVTIDESLAEDMWLEYKEAQFDEFEYKEELEETFDNILDMISDGIRERLDARQVDVGTIKAYAEKWKALLADFEEAVAKSDGQYEGGCPRLVNPEDMVDEA